MKVVTAQLDRRDCPDWMHIRQFVYLEETSPRVLASILDPRSRELHTGERATWRRGQRQPDPINLAGMVRQRFPQQFARGSRCALCGVVTVRGEDVAYWGRGPAFGHALCRIAEWTARHDAAQERRARDAEHSRRRRKGRR